MPQQMRSLRAALGVALFPLWFWPLALAALAIPCSLAGLLVMGHASPAAFWGPIGVAFWVGLFVLLFSIPTSLLLALVVYIYGFVSQRAALAVAALVAVGWAIASVMVSDDITGIERVFAILVLWAMFSAYVIPVTLAMIWALARLGILPSGWPSGRKS